MVIPGKLFPLACCIVVACAPMRVEPALKLESQASALMDAALVPGAQIAIVRDGRLAAVEALGVADAGSRRAVTPATVFEAGSLGKPVFAYGVLRLVSEGRLDLDAAIGSYLPDLDTRLRPLTARMLLSHRAGLPNSAQGPLAPTASGTRFSYSGEGYALLQKVVEKISGRSLNDYMSIAVFDPLGMTSSSYVWRDDYRDTKAFGHGHAGASAGRNRIPEARAQSSLETTAADYARFMLAVVQGRGLSRDAHKLLVSPQTAVEQGCVECLGKPVAAASKTIGWSLGWGTARTGGKPMLWHWGDNGTMQAYAAIQLDGRRGLVVLTNSANGHSMIPVLARAALGAEAPGYEWLGSYGAFDRPARALLSRIVRDGVGALSADDLAASPADRQLVARRLIDGRRPAEAAAFLKRAETHSALTGADLTLLADARRRSGDLAAARTAARAALALQPDAAGALAALEKIDMAERRVPLATLRDYVARYATPFGPMDIVLVDQGLEARLEDQPESAMLPLSDTKFLMESMGLPIEFVRGPDGSVTHAMVTAGQQSFKLERTGTPNR